MLPLPPHCTSRIPPGRSAPASRPHMRSWSLTQCSAAVEMMTSTGSARSRSSTSWHHTWARSPEPRSCERHHVLRRIDREHATAGQKREQGLGHSPSPAAHVEDRRVPGDAMQPGEDIRGPRLLRRARDVVGPRVPGRGHRRPQPRRPSRARAPWAEQPVDQGAAPLSVVQEGSMARCGGPQDARWPSARPRAGRSPDRRRGHRLPRP